MPNPKTNLLRVILILILAFVSVTSFIGAYGLITNTGGVPLSLIEGSVFSSFLIPGLILGFIVGGVNFAAFWLLTKNYAWGAEVSALAGCVLATWIFVEMYIIESSHWLHALYFGLAILTIILSLLVVRLRC